MPAVWCDVGRDESADRTVDDKTTCKRLASRGGMAGRAIACPCEVFALGDQGRIAIGSLPGEGWRYAQ